MEVSRSISPNNPTKQLEFMGDVLAGVIAAVMVPYTQDAGSLAILGIHATGKVLATINRAIELKAAESEKPRESIRIQ